jgi:hypothetical protein
MPKSASCQVVKEAWNLQEALFISSEKLLIQIAEPTHNRLYDQTLFGESAFKTFCPSQYRTVVGNLEIPRAEHETTALQKLQIERTIRYVTMKAPSTRRTRDSSA